MIICNECLNIIKVWRPLETKSSLCVIIASILKNPSTLYEHTLVQLLDLNKRNRVLSQQNNNRKTAMLLSHALLLWALTHFYGYKEKDVCLLRNTMGKPYLTSPPLSPSYLRRVSKPISTPFFSISYRYPYVGIAFSLKEVGFDLEIWQPGINDIGPLYCSQKELRYIQNSPHPSHSMLHLWTQKEALLKQRGCGISENAPLSSVTAKQEETVVTKETDWGCFSLAFIGSTDEKF